MPEISVSSRDGGKFAAYLTEQGTGRRPGLVLIQEIFGVNANMRAIADNYARRGMVVVCPDLFWRLQPGVQLDPETEAGFNRAIELYQQFDQNKGVEDLIAALDYVRSLPQCSGKVGTIGFCLGGKLAYLMATRSNADANVSYYGVGIEAALDEAAKIRHPLLMHVAEADQFVPPPAQQAIKTGLQSNKQVSIHTYPKADHAFAREGGHHYNAEAAALANGRTRDFIKAHLA